MNEFQYRLLSIANWFHHFCITNNLRYFMIGGSFLGAVRHKGFIPWDDDFDVAMPRPDYEKMIKLTQGKIFKNYKIESLTDEADDWIYAYAKIYDTKSTLIEDVRQKTRRGIYLDIFPIDGFGSSTFLAKLKYRPIQIALWILTLKTISDNPNRSFIKRVLLFLFNNSLTKHLINIKTLLRFINTTCQRTSYESSEILGNMPPVSG